MKYRLARAYIQQTKCIRCDRNFKVEDAEDGNFSFDVSYSGGFSSSDLDEDEQEMDIDISCEKCGKDNKYQTVPEMNVEKLAETLVDFYENYDATRQARVNIKRLICFYLLYSTDYALKFRTILEKKCNFYDHLLQFIEKVCE